MNAAGANDLRVDPRRSPGIGIETEQDALPIDASFVDESDSLGETLRDQTVMPDFGCSADDDRSRLYRQIRTENGTRS